MWTFHGVVFHSVKRCLLSVHNDMWTFCKWVIIQVKSCVLMCTQFVLCTPMSFQKVSIFAMNPPKLRNRVTCLLYFKTKIFSNSFKTLKRKKEMHFSWPEQKQSKIHVLVLPVGLKIWLYIPCYGINLKKKFLPQKIKTLIK